MYIAYIYTGTTNNLLQVETDVRNQIVQCRFLRAFNGRAECQVEFSTQEDFSNSIVATGSSTSGDTIIVTLKATLEGRATYYYRVTATAEGVSVRVEDIIQTPPIQGISTYSHIIHCRHEFRWVHSSLIPRPSLAAFFTAACMLFHGCEKSCSLVPRPPLAAFFSQSWENACFSMAAKKAVKEGLGTKLGSQQLPV